MLGKHIMNFNHKILKLPFWSAFRTQMSDEKVIQNFILSESLLLGSLFPIAELFKWEHKTLCSGVRLEQSLPVYGVENHIVE